MPQSLARVVVHIIFSTKHRRPWLKDANVRAETYAYMATVLSENVDSPAMLINGVEDHVHILCSLSRKFAIKNVVEKAKTETTKWMKRQSPKLRDFHWQNGYGVFSVSESKVAEVKRYIERQETHHRRMTFQDEFREICRRHGLEPDERYAWD